MPWPKGNSEFVEWDHTESMVLALQLYDVYREFILGFASKNIGR